MKNKFISALITIFFLEKSSEGMNEKTERSSWFRTSVYLFLTSIFAVFFYRSSQVSTIINRVEISSLRGDEDSLHNSLDTIDIIIIANDFKTLGSYKNPSIDYQKKDSSYIEGGGVLIVFDEPSSAGIIQNKDSLTDEKIKEIETLTGRPIKPYTGSIYSVEFIARSNPSLFPIYPQMKADKPLVKNDTLFSTIEYVGNLKNIDGLKGKILIAKPDHAADGAFVDAISYKQTTINHYDGIRLKYMTLHHRLANTLNVFSACDLSQYTYILTLSSDVYIKQLSVAYNVPVEVGNQVDGLYVGTNNFGIEDAALLNRLLDQPLCFLVKLPSMANLQQIRSIILTALISALFSLFCTNFFYRVRKVVMYYMLKHRIIISEWVKQNSDSLKNFKFLFFTIILVILFSILLFTCLGACGYTFLIDYGKATWKPILFVFLFISFVSGSIYLLSLLSRKNGLKVL